MAAGAAAPRSAPPVGDRQRYHFLDGLRGVAAVLVVMHHFALTWEENRRLFGAAPLAVDFFFCLSGFVIAHAYGERLRAGMTLRQYGLRRVVRLYPMYVLGAILGIAGLVALKLRGLTDLPWSAMADATALHLFYIPYFNDYGQHLFDNHPRGTLFPLNNPAWSLFFELLCANAVYALAARASKWAPLAITAVSAVALVYMARRYGSTPGWGAHNFAGGFPRVLYAFFAGVVVFQFRGRLAGLRTRPLIVLTAVVLLFGMPRMAGFSHYWLISALLAVPLFVATAACADFPAGSGKRRIADYWGRLSYPLYCVHFPLLMLLAALGWRPATFPGAMGLFLVACLAVAHGLMVHVDEPVRRWLDGRLARRALQPARPG